MKGKNVLLAVLHSTGQIVRVAEWDRMPSFEQTHNATVGSVHCCKCRKGETHREACASNWILGVEMLKEGETWTF